MGFITEIHDGAEVGGKARSLAKLAAAGLPTPAGFVMTDELFRSLVATSALPSRLDESGLQVLDAMAAQLHTRAWPAGLTDELRLRLAHTGAAHWSVRSSFATEDRAGGLGAGVFESRVAVATADVESAIRQVLASALSAGAVAYALAHAMDPAAPPVCVLVHAYTPGEAEGSAAWAPATGEPLVWVRAGTLEVEPAVRLKKALAALGQRFGAVEVEWVLDAGRLVFLQMRPYQPPVPPAPWSGWDELGGQGRAAWKWDAAHNPLPLSPAQAGLVALTDEACRVGFRQRVLGGYLFYASDPGCTGPTLSFSEAEQRFVELREQIEAALHDSASLERALSLFLAVHEAILGAIQPALRRKREHLARLLRQHAPAAAHLLPTLYDGVESLAAERHRRAWAVKAAADPGARTLALARFLDLFGDEAAIWDVAQPTHHEQPDALFPSARSSPAPAASAWCVVAEGVEEQLRPELRSAWRLCVAEARRAAGLGEDDDWLYARAQAAVRRALLDLGHQLADSGRLGSAEDVFWLPLSLSRELVRGQAGPADLRALAQTARRAWEAARANPPPVPAAQGPVLRGVGTAGRALGRVFIYRSGAASSVPAGSVVVAQTLLPTELPLIDAAALVTEVGGALDHVAAQARERHLPAVVGVAGAVSALADGELALVDADHGVVVRLGSLR